MDYTAELKESVIVQVRKVLGDSGLAKKIIDSAGSKKGFEIRYRSMPPGVMASTSAHAQLALENTKDNPGYYEFVDDALRVPLSLVDDGSVKYKIEFLPKRFRMDRAAVGLFAKAWDEFSKRYCMA